MLASGYATGAMNAFFDPCPRETCILYKENENVKIPVIGDNDAVTDKFILYRYNGKYFEEVRK
jgi:hypothetical protein